MDRGILVSLSTGMLLFHERYNGEDETDIDEMQLASYFSALFHVRAEMKLEMQSFDPPVSLFQEGSSTWAISLIKQGPFRYLIGLYSRSFRYSINFWNILFLTIQQGLFGISLDNFDSPRVKKSFQKCLHESFSKSIKQLSRKLPFSLFEDRKCEIIAVVSSCEKKSSPILTEEKVPALHLLSPSDGPPSSIVDSISPRPKAAELRSPVESATTGVAPDIPIKTSGSWFCCGAKSSVSAIATESSRPNSNNSTPITVQLTPSEKHSSNPYPIDIGTPIITGNLKKYRVVSLAHDREVYNGVDFPRLCDQFDSQPQSSQRVNTLRELDENWNILFGLKWDHCSLPPEEHRFSDEIARPPSPSEDRNNLDETSRDELKVVSLEDDPPSPPRKASVNNNPSGAEAVHLESQFSKYLVSLHDSVYVLLCISASIADKDKMDLNRVIKDQHLDEFKYFFAFCSNMGWLLDEQRLIS